MGRKYVEREVVTSFEVDCRKVVSTHKVVLKNTKTGEKFYAPAKNWRWRNSWAADVTFEFRGKEFTVCAEVDPVFPCWL